MTILRERERGGALNMKHCQCLFVFTHRVDFESPCQSVDLHGLGVQLLSSALELAEWMDLEQTRVIGRSELTAAGGWGRNMIKGIILLVSYLMKSEDDGREQSWKEFDLSLCSRS